MVIVPEVRLLVTDDIDTPDRGPGRVLDACVRGLRLIQEGTHLLAGKGLKSRKNGKNPCTSAMAARPTPPRRLVMRRRILRCTPANGEEEGTGREHGDQDRSAQERKEEEEKDAAEPCREEVDGVQRANPSDRGR